MAEHGAQSEHDTDQSAGSSAEATSAPPARLERGLHAGAALLVLVTAFLLAAFPAVSDDLFMHLAAGRRFLQTGSFPDPDPWIFSIPDYHRHWIDVAYWGMHLGVTKLHAWGGFPLLVLVKTAFVVAGAAAPLWLARRLGWSSFAVPAVAALGLWAASDRFLERGSLVSDCIGPWVLALTAAELVRPGRLRWVLPVLVLVWTNLHPGVVLGLACIAGAALLRAREWRRWLPLLLACGAASVAHPDGAGHLLWALQSAQRASGAGSGAFREFNFEMMPTLSDLHAGERETRLFLLLALIAWGVVIHAFARRARPWYGALVLAAFTVLGLSAVRHVATASMALPVVVVLVAAARGARSSAVRPAQAWSRRARVGAVAVVVTALASLDVSVAVTGYRAASGARRFGFGLDRSAYPFGAAEFVRALPHAGGIFNEQQWGAFLAWAWDGNPRIYFHGYVLDEEFYGESYAAVNRSHADFDRIVGAHDLDVFLLRRIPVDVQRGPLLHRLLLTRPDWHLVYWDARSMVFLRDRPENAAAIAAHEFRWLDPFRPDRLARGLKEAPQSVLAECRRQLRSAPNDPYAYNVVWNAFHLDPATVAR